MKKLIPLFFLLVFYLIISSRTSPKVNIPDQVDTILHRSCNPCHYDGGSHKALLKLNLSKWEDYSPNQREDKAEKICSELQDEDMPPQSARDKHPERIPTNDQVDAICKWTGSLLEN